MGLFKKKIKVKQSLKQTIIDEFYSDYPEIPYISDDREENWIETAEMFKQALVQKKMMIRYYDGLLPGHVYMLYWLNKYNNKNVPGYFEYKFGIDFEKEKALLRKKGYLSDYDKPTEKGLNTIESHYEVIEEMHPSPIHKRESEKHDSYAHDFGRKIPENDEFYPKTAESDKRLIKKEFDYIEMFAALAMELAEINNNYKINTKNFYYGTDSTHYVYTPKTESGRISKYPLMLKYQYSENNSINLSNDRFGEIYYTRDGRIGKARLIYWDNYNGCVINIGLINKKLAVKKVEVSGDDNWILMYKA